jgi:hypothetical protein
MSKREEWRQALRALTDWEPYLLQHCRLPGPRANLELAQAVADEGDEAAFQRLLRWDATRAPTNTPAEFLALCGVVGLGRLVADGQAEHLPSMRAYAADPRWRVREGVVLGLQRVGTRDMDALLTEMEVWATGDAYEQRAAVAALCEPVLLREPAQVRRVLGVLDHVTASLAASDARQDSERVLAQGLSYCWSVAVAALPDVGKPMMERWLASDSPVVVRVVRENLKKQRLGRLDAAWVEAQLRRR